MQNENQKLIDLMKSLEIFTGQDIQTLEKIVIRRFVLMKELARTVKQGEGVQAKENSKDLSSPVF